MSKTHDALPYAVTATDEPAAAVLEAMPITPEVSDVAALTAREAEETVASFWRKFAVLPFEVKLMVDGPTGPVGPAGPCGPWGPCDPVGPVEPTGPCEPVGP